MSKGVKIPVRIVRDEPNAPSTQEVKEECRMVEIPAAPEQYQTELEELEKERDRYLSFSRRTQRAFDEYRKRTRIELAEAKESALAGFLSTLLPAFDDLDRVISEGSKEQNVHTILTGLRLTRDNLWRAMENAGVSSVPAEPGQAFDPAMHEAIATRPDAEQSPGTIDETLQQGFQLGGKLLRPARVVVSTESTSVC